ncbi:MAG: hypothetical protein AAGH15_05320 [Myxococcota bacterium]
MRRARTFGLTGLLLVALGGTAAAQAPLRVYVAPDLAVDRGAVRAMLEADLERPVTLVETAAAPGELLLVEAPGDELRVTYRSPEGHRIERRLPDAPGDPVERTRTVALVAINLARDESLEILQLLARDAQAPTAAAAPPPVVEVPATEAPSVGAPVARVPEPEVPVAATAPAPVPELRDSPRQLWFGADFAPGVGFSTFYRGRDRRAVSLGFLGAWTGQLDGVAVSLGVDVVTGDARGLQAAAGGAYVQRDLEGFQTAAGAAIVRGDVRGAQVAAGLSLSTGDVEGLQIAAGAAWTHGDLDGLQAAAGLGWVEGDLEGVQLASLGMVRGDLVGVQAGPVNIVRGGAMGAQLGIVNYAGGNVRGTQIGLINVAGGRVHGAQLGLLNIAEEADWGIGAVSLYRRARTQLRIGVDTDTNLRLELHHGSRYLRSILVAGLTPTNGGRLRVGPGFGGRIPLGRVVELSLGILGQALIPFAEDDPTPDLMVEGRGGLSFRVTEDFAIFATFALQAQLSWRDVPLDGVGRLGAATPENDPELAEIRESGSPLASVSPLITVGVELF